MEEINENDYRTFIGKKGDYYLERWKKMKNKNTLVSWNWGCFFFGVLWLLYRKMYFYTLLVLGLFTAISLFVEFIIGGPLVLETAFVTLAWIAIVTSANHLYREHVERKILKIKDKCGVGDLLIAELAKKGGTTWLLPLLYVIFLFAVLMV